ncbi:uncharacterized protein OCT59_028231 [Rhizophagus irregularis]|uniref:uncharacterized protein n=1 Tax=Rhizophagus irregularis TaxID=588596 RepID=UPI0033166A93|nr:hypothetical protein OCT59_028231 [Rhizophagus irregularis]
MSAQWSEEQTRMLIDERKNGNEEYHRTSIRNKRNFWEDIANEINRVNNTNYFTGEDCNKKFLALTRAYYTTVAYKKAKAEAESLLLSTNEGSGVEGPPTTVVTKKKKRSLIGEHYYEEFSTEFWKEPDYNRQESPDQCHHLPWDPVLLQEPELLQKFLEQFLLIHRVQQHLLLVRDP